MQRKKIQLSDSIQDIIVNMSEGNMGGLTAMMDLLKLPEGLMLVLSLDDMNIRGSQIWVGYKDYCQENVNKFAECIKHRDAGMVSTINQQIPYHVAVTSGASYER